MSMSRHQAHVLFHHVSFTHTTARTPLFTDVTVHFPPGWTGIVGANGAGKTTLLHLATGALSPQQGTVQAPADALYCPQRTESVPALLIEFLQATDGEAYTLKGRLGIAENWLQRWQTLSHGERKRAQLGVALWRQPPVLAVDEPTNHLDAEARQMVLTALHAFVGVGLLVSHDRTLLDALCCQCLFLDPPGAILRPGGVTQGMQQARIEAEHLRQQAALARSERLRLEQEARARRKEASRSQAKRSKRGLDRKDHDARSKINLARVTGKDGAAGKRLRQIQGRVEQARQQEQRIPIRKTYSLGLWLPGAYSRRNTLFILPAGTLPLGGARRLHVPDLVMQPRDRIALVGSNGSGKSTLVRHFVSVVPLPPTQVTYIPQEIDGATAQALLARVRGLPKDRLGYLMTVVSGLGSRPPRLLDTSAPSPGEIRKLLLTLGITQTPHLIIMDEPTNHLDLPSIACLEQALAECPCGLLLVSHDQDFLNRLTTLRWQITAAQRSIQDGDTHLHITTPQVSG
jgi:ATPase subunit of ABC transporter with duplicated ATPase domains